MKRRFSKNIFFLFAIAIQWSFETSAQDFTNTYFQAGLFSGYAIKNHPAFPPVNSPALGAEFRTGICLNGNKAWHNSYRNGFAGISLSTGLLGNEKVLGNFFSLIPELTVPFGRSNRWSSSVSVGIGASYFDKPFNKISNPENIVIGSRFTFCALAAFNFSYRLNSQVSLVLRPVIYHASNSHSSLPNVGLNLPVIGAGIFYSHTDPLRTTIRDSVFMMDRKIHLSIRSGIAWNEQGGSTGPPDGPKYPIYIASIFVSKKISIVNKLQAGIEAWYNSGVYDYIMSQDFYNDHQEIRSTAIVLFVGHEFLFGHASLVTQGGVYLYNPFYRDKIRTNENASLKEKLKTWFPARIGLQYYWFDETQRRSSNIYTGIYIKTNLGQADFLDTAIGFRF